ncbi:hypothetical protein SALBM217S_02935 [Streptomyces griseoloalbus]
MVAVTNRSPARSASFCRRPVRAIQVGTTLLTAVPTTPGKVA